MVNVKDPKDIEKLRKKIGSINDTKSKERLLKELKEKQKTVTK